MYLDISPELIIYLHIKTTNPSRERGNEIIRMGSSR
jgi:hypothetical protein